MFFLVVYTLLMGFMFLSYIYSADVNTGSTSHRSSKDVIIFKKSATRNFLEGADSEGRILLQMSMPKPGKPPRVQHHFKSLRTGEVST